MSVTARVKGQAKSLSQEGRKAVQGGATSHLVETLMRVGYVTRGLIYAIIGVLAVQVVLGGSGTLTDPKGAIAVMGTTPLGSVVLYAVLLGLVGYGLWGLIRAIFDPLHKGTDAKGVAERVGYLVSGISYSFLAFSTYGMIAGGSSGSSSGAQTQQGAATILSQPYGAVLVGLVAAIIMVVGVMQIVKGLQSKFDQQFTAYQLDANQRKWITRMGQFGTAARGLVFTLIGVFLFQAAYTNDASHAKGIDGVLNELLRQPAGPLMLGVVALGLIAFGAYSIMSGVWLRLKR